MDALRFASAYVLPLAAALGLHLGGPWLLLTPAVVFLLVPLADALLRPDLRNPDEAEVARRARNPLYDVWLLLWPPAQLGLLAWTLVHAGDAGVPARERALAAAGMGLVAGAGGITIAHELMHRPARLHRALGELLMTLVAYPHFCVEHVLGHHRRVATRADPATARLGEPLPGFLVRTLWGSLASAWRLEGQRAARVGLRRGSLRDRRVRMPLALGLVAGAIAWTTGAPGLVAFLGQALVAVLLLEVINYVEHYGLERARRPDGRPEVVSARHSWNSSRRASGALLFELTRHADHHAAASRPYWALRHLDDGPELPAGYPVMILVALVPPLWRRVMDPRVARWAARGTSPAPAALPA